MTHRSALAQFPSGSPGQRRVGSPAAWVVVSVMLAMALPSLAWGRTVTQDDTQVMLIAHIGREIPEASWLGRHSSPGIFVTNFMDMTPGRRFLIRYPIENIPPGQRIVSATLTIPVATGPASPVRFFVWRILADWGLGVNHEYRMQVPEPVRWASPGLGAPGIDRALNPSAVVSVENANEINIDLTQDVETWYTGIAPNRGWVMAIDEANAFLRLEAPLYATGRGRYTLRITYEPE